MKGIEISKIPLGAGSSSMQSHTVGISSEFSKLLAAPLSKDLVHLQQQLERHEFISPRQLLLYQLRMGEFNLRVELVSKVAESLLSTVRKLQSGQ